MSDSKSSRAKKKKKRARAKNSSPQNMAPVQASPADQVLSAPETVETAANSETAATPETVEPAVPLEKTPDGPHGSPLVVAPEGAGEKSAGRKLAAFLSRLTDKMLGMNVPSPDIARLEGGSEKEQVERTYRLKTMVLARIMAEATALMAMVITPLLLFFFGGFAQFSAVVKFLFLAVALVAACILPAYGFITYQVTLCGSLLTAHSMLRKTSCRLDQITGLTRRSSLKFVRFVVEFDGGELTFPIWLKSVDELVALLRRSLPAYLGSARLSSGRTFKQDGLATVLQVAQVLISLIFVVVVWLFTVAILKGGDSGNSDILLLAVFAAAASLVLVYRAYVVLLMPSAIKLTDKGIQVKTFFFTREVSRENLTEVKEPMPLLPEGFVIASKQGDFLVGQSMDAADELEKALREMLPAGS
ncbi:MAG TPA: hypothetical protein PL012_12175 [Candidatus Obscuribacter sp.]|nr:hypothetical protein [Candidatus Obscuribacter sp.]